MDDNESQTISTLNVPRLVLDEIQKFLLDDSNDIMPICTFDCTGAEIATDEQYCLSLEVYVGDNAGFMTDKPYSYDTKSIIYKKWGTIRIFRLRLLQFTIVQGVFLHKGVIDQDTKKPIQA
jgi:hypothetical protein